MNCKKAVMLTVIIGICLVLVPSLYAGDPKKIPAVITLDSISDKYDPVFFTHERHTSLAGNCGSCHHEHENYGSLQCKSCHAVNTSLFKDSVTHNFMACRNCHGTANPATPRILSLKKAYHAQCFQCHKGMGSVGSEPKGCTELCHAKKEQKLSMTR